MYLETCNNFGTLEQHDASQQPQFEIKMFVHSQPREAEKEVSNWLKANRVTLHYITQSQSEKGGNLVFVISLFYSQSAA